MLQARRKNVVWIFLVVVAAGCTSAPDEASSHDTTPDPIETPTAEPTFDGTEVEWAYAMASCFEDNGMPSEADIRAIYQFELQAHQCLKDNGYAVADPISEDQYVEEYLSSNGPSWLAHISVGRENDLAAHEECPQSAELFRESQNRNIEA